MLQKIVFSLVILAKFLNYIASSSDTVGSRHTAVYVQTVMRGNEPAGLVENFKILFSAHLWLPFVDLKKSSLMVKIEHDLRVVAILNLGMSFLRGRADC